jgi:hypothetical protein
MMLLTRETFLGFPLPLKELQGHQIAGGISRCHVGIELVGIDLSKRGIDPASAAALYIPEREEFLHQILNVTFKAAMTQFKPCARLQIPERLFGRIPDHRMKKTSNVIAEVIQVIEVLTGKINGGLESNV